MGLAALDIRTLWVRPPEPLSWRGGARAPRGPGGCRAHYPNGASQKSLGGKLQVGDLGTGQLLLLPLLAFG